jgi:uncharacterized protein YbjQ (UPF0145 family)
MMIVSTTPTIEGKRISQYLGLASGDAILQASLSKELSPAGMMKSIVSGGRSAFREEQLRQAKQLAIDEMVEQATELGANAVVAVDLGYAVISSGEYRSDRLMVSATGTAVVVEE